MVNIDYVGIGLHVYAGMYSTALCIFISRLAFSGVAYCVSSSCGACALTGGFGQAITLPPQVLLIDREFTHTDTDLRSILWKGNYTLEFGLNRL